MKKLLGLLVLCLLAACSINKVDRQSSLAEKHQPYFKIGAAVDSNTYHSHEKLLKKHFNSITTENEMKFELLQPLEGVFLFDTADRMINFARDNNMGTRGHALVWHRQTPMWVFQDKDGGPASKELLRQRMRTHIFTVMQHFKGRVDAWDVVNEAIMDDGRLRTDKETADDQRSSWYGILGEEYIELAFQYAHEADPDAKLYYNDYYNFIPARREAIYKLVKGLLDKGVKVDGIGIQGHINIAASDDPKHPSYHQSIDNLEKAIKRYASLGIDVEITELDISVYVGGKAKTHADYLTYDSFNEKLQMQQAERYRALFDMLRRNHQYISRVTFWGVADDNTWLSEFPSGRKDFPFLFDIKQQPKKAFDAVMDF